MIYHQVYEYTKIIDNDMEQGCAPSVTAASHPIAPGIKYLTPYWVPFG